MGRRIQLPLLETRLSGGSLGRRCQRASLTRSNRRRWGEIGTRGDLRRMCRRYSWPGWCGWRGFLGRWSKCRLDGRFWYGMGGDRLRLSMPSYVLRFGCRGLHLGKWSLRLGHRRDGMCFRRLVCRRGHIYCDVLWFGLCLVLGERDGRRNRLSCLILYMWAWHFFLHNSILPFDRHRLHWCQCCCCGSGWFVVLLLQPFQLSPNFCIFFLIVPNFPGD